MRRVLIATGNEGKLHEFRRLLGDIAEMVSLTDIALESPEETGETFLDNALIKARVGAERSGLLTIADDSGLEVAVLGGGPGVRSARYAGERATDEDNRHLLLRTLGQENDRRARYVAVISVCEPNGRCESFEGGWNGTIGHEPRGAGGFGYDSIFQLPDGRTVAELTADEKNAISHRGEALRRALPTIRAMIDRT